MLRIVYGKDPYRFRMIIAITPLEINILRLRRGIFISIKMPILRLKGDYGHFKLLKYTEGALWRFLFVLICPFEMSF